MRGPVIEGIEGRLLVLEEDVRILKEQAAAQAAEIAGLKGSVNTLQSYDLKHNEDLKRAMELAENACRTAADALAVVRVAAGMQTV